MSKIGNYKIIGKIGAGGMATVYKGVQISLNRPVAVKVLNQQLTDDPDMVKRFNRESLIIARLSHPNIIHIIDRGLTGKGMPYFVMDYIQGTDLLTVLKENRFDFKQKLDTIIQVCKALGYAHKNGVIHRDIKPANILMDSENNTLVSDFGISQLMERDKNGEQFTQVGMTMGSPSYMSPEQKTSFSQVSAASDLYSLGVVMYELFTGVKPLGRFKPPSLINSEIPEALEHVILKCLEPQPGDRFQSADEIKDRLLQILQGRHIGDTQRKKSIEGMTRMEASFDLLDIIRETDYSGVYLLRHKIKGGLMVAKKYKSAMGGLKEAKLLNNLKHEHIVEIYGVSGDENVFIVVMEYVSGGSLKDRMIRPHPYIEVLKTARELCEAMAFANKNRIVHGNLRPSNILITPEGRVKIADFGLREHYSQDRDKTNWYNIYDTKLSVQTDVFAAGAIFYEMLMGAVPMWGVDGFKPHKEFNHLPRDFQTLIEKMLSREPSARFGSFDEILGRVENMIEDYVPPAPVKKTAPANQPQPRKKTKTGKRLFFLALLIISLVAGAGAFVLLSGRGDALLHGIMRLFK